MGLNYRPLTLFNPVWVAALRGAPESAMNAQVHIYDPKISGDIYDAETDTWTKVPLPIYTGKARVQPLRGDNAKDQPGNATNVRAVLVSVPISEAATNFRIGQQMNVLEAPLGPALETYQFVMTGTVDSANEIERTLMFVVNQETANG